MTYEELKKVPFHFVSHLSMENMHCTVYESKDKRISFCDHVPYKNGEPKGRSYRHYTRAIYPSLNKNKDYEKEKTTYAN